MRKTLLLAVALLLASTMAHASTVVIFDEAATPQRVLGVIRSANTPEFTERTDVVINPDLSALDGVVPRRYWKHDTGAIIEYTQGEKDAQDAAEAAAADAALREGAKGQFDGQAGLYLRAFADILKDEINVLRALHGLPPRTLAQLKSAIQSRIDSGDVDE